MSLSNEYDTNCVLLSLYFTFSFLGDIMGIDVSVFPSWANDTDSNSS